MGGFFLGDIFLGDFFMGGKFPGDFFLGDFFWGFFFRGDFFLTPRKSVHLPPSCLDDDTWYFDMSLRIVYIIIDNARASILTRT